MRVCVSVCMYTYDPVPAVEVKDLLLQVWALVKMFAIEDFVLKKLL